jgi:hypothetical protein
LSSGIRDRFKADQPFGSFQVYAPPAASFATYTYRGNSVYDPDFSGTGSTASSYTQLSALYNRYRVFGSRLEIDAINLGTTPLTVYICASITNTPPTIASGGLIAARHVFERTVGAAGSGPIFLKHTASARTSKIFGVPETQVLCEDDFAGLVGGNPNNVWYWHLVVFNPSAAAAGSMNIKVRINYDTVWSMPLNLLP